MNNKNKRRWIYLRRHFSWIGVISVVFVVNMLFFDENSLIQSIILNRRINNLERDINHYRQVIKESRSQLDNLQTDEQNLERFARERFHMKAPDEEIFIIEEAE